MAWLYISVNYRGIMDTPIIELDGEVVPVEVDDEPGPQVVLNQELPALPEVTVRWEGTLQPTFNLWGRSSEPLMFDSYPHGCIASWG
jgi:hypothetical protein